jgi:hypothetical protein
MKKSLLRGRHRKARLWAKAWAKLLCSAERKTFYAVTRTNMFDPCSGSPAILLPASTWQ